MCALFHNVVSCVCMIVWVCGSCGSIPKNFSHCSMVPINVITHYIICVWVIKQRYTLISLNKIGYNGSIGKHRFRNVNMKLERILIVWIWIWNENRFNALSLSWFALPNFYEHLQDFIMSIWFVYAWLHLVIRSLFN